MLTLPPVAPATGWRASTRLPRDHYVRVDTNDYSVHPAVIGRRIEVLADLAPGDGALRRPGGRRPRPDLGQAPDDHPTPTTSPPRRALRRDRIGLVRPGTRDRGRDPGADRLRHAALGLDGGVA